MSYYRQSFSFGPPLTRMVKGLIIATSAVFLITYVPAKIFFGSELPLGTVWFGLTPYLVTHLGFIWQPFTYLFWHGGFFHIIFNMFALWMFGSDVENAWGGRRFLFYYFLTGVGAGLVDVLFEPSSRVPVIGCSGAVFGLLLAYGVLFPNRSIYVYMLIPIKAKWFVAIMGLIEVVNEFGQPGSGISHIAHLGGLLVGLIYLKGGGLKGGLGLRHRYDDWKRARLRRKFEVYMRRQERSDRKDDRGRWIN